MGIKKLRLLTRDRRRVVGLEGYGLEIVERDPPHLNYLFMSTDPPTARVIDPSPFSFGIVCARFNESLTQHLLNRVLQVLQEQGKPANLVVERVPGSHEVPAGLSLLAESGRFSCLLGLGVVIKGSTSHHHLVAESAGNAIQS